MRDVLGVLRPSATAFWRGLRLVAPWNSCYGDSEGVWDAWVGLCQRSCLFFCVTRNYDWPAAPWLLGHVMNRRAVPSLRKYPARAGEKTRPPPCAFGHGWGRPSAPVTCSGTPARGCRPYLLLVRLGRQPRQRPHLTEFLPDLLPRIPPVIAAKQLAVQATGQHEVGVCWVGRETTDIAVG